MCMAAVRRVAPPTLPPVQSPGAAREHDAGVLFSLEDSGEAEDVGGLHEEAAHDGRAQRPVRGPDARPGESRRGRSQGLHRRDGKRARLEYFLISISSTVSTSSIYSHLII